MELGANDILTVGTDGSMNTRDLRAAREAGAMRFRRTPVEMPTEQDDRFPSDAGTHDATDSGGPPPVVWTVPRPDPAPNGGSAPAAETTTGVRPTKARLGELLVSRGAISSEQLGAALAEQSGSGRRLGEVLVELGVLGERDFLEALAEQFGLPLVDLRKIVPEVAALDRLPESVVRTEQVLPVRVAGGALLVAISVEPTRELVDRLVAAAGTPVRLLLALHADIERAIDRCYSALADLDRLASSYDTEGTERDATTSGSLTIDDNAPVVQIVTRILTQAVRSRASDIHVEPQDDRVRVRFRVDGALYDAVTLPAGIAQALVSRLKIMADMNIVERRRSQDGQFEITVDDRALDVRVATTSTIWGEKAVLRLLDQ